MTLPSDNIGDKGQRYEIHCIDADGKDFLMGWSNNPDWFLETVKLHPSFHSRYVIDRWIGEE